MIRKVFRFAFGLLLRLFFRDIEIVGEENIPKTGPVLFVLNHHNGLVDPGLVLCLTSRPVSFLAKATLFKMPVVSTIVRGFDSLPIYRKQDQGNDLQQNVETFKQAHALLDGGGTIAMFPEGTSHSDSKMKRLKTGAARIALGAQLENLQVVPGGLYYTEKGTFRSDVLLAYGKGFAVQKVEPDANGDPPQDAVLALTDEIEASLSKVLLLAENHEALRLIERAEKIFSAAAQDDEESPLSERFALRQRLLEGFHSLKETRPEKIDAVASRIRRHGRMLDAVGLPHDHPSPDQYTFSKSLHYAIRSIFTLLVLLPFALIGLISNFVPYRLVGTFALRMSKDKDDMAATLKLLSSLFFFPVTWLALAGGVFLLSDVWWLLGVLVLCPFSGYVALRFLEHFDRMIEATRGLWVFLAKRNYMERIHRQRTEIREMILELNELLEAH